MPEFTSKQREKLADENEAMPDGSYPIRNRSDLKNAIQAFGRSKNPEKTKAWIKKRARELDAEDLIPESWLEHGDDSAYLIHYGVLGMKWGVRKAKKPASITSKKSQRINKKVAKYNAKSKTEASKSKEYKRMAEDRLARNAPKIAKLESKKAKYQYKESKNRVNGWDFDADTYYLKTEKINKKIQQLISDREYYDGKSFQSSIKSTRYKEKADNLVSKYKNVPIVDAKKKKK